MCGKNAGINVLSSGVSILKRNTCVMFENKGGMFKKSVCLY
jgi:hypothetical protein